MSSDSVKKRGRPSKRTRNGVDGAPNAKRTCPAEPGENNKLSDAKHMYDDSSDAGNAPTLQKWTTLKHNGILFPAAYEPHSVPLIYDGVKITLPPPAEEVASAFAKVLNTQHVQNPTFVQNFFACFLQVLDEHAPGHSIVEFAKCNFENIALHLLAKSLEKKVARKANKEADAKQKAELKAHYGFVEVDGASEPLANYIVEPPSLFLGRGDHPKAGMWKSRVFPENVILNIGQNMPIPPCPMEGHHWGAVVHDPNGAWIARWQDSISNRYKYVRFSYLSSLGSACDRKKYERARMLKTIIQKVRDGYMADLSSEKLVDRQRATVIWFLDHLALRVGNEKNLQEMADTVGCCSLRVEHVRLEAPLQVHLDFLAKDSMRYTNSVTVPDSIFCALKEFCSNKKPTDKLFECIEPSTLNAHLKSIMPGLTAKVFRTYNASTILQRELGTFDQAFVGEPVPINPAKIRLFYNRANRQVAVLCNHQKAPPKALAQQIENLSLKIANLQEQVVQLERHVELLQSADVSTPSDSDSDQPVEKYPTMCGEENVEKVKDDAKLVDDDAQGKAKKRLKLPKTVEATRNKIETVRASIAKLQSQIEDKSEGARIQNSTSKINYMDPRITAAFCKKTGMAIRMVYPDTLVQRFTWAIQEVEEDPDFIF